MYSIVMCMLQSWGTLPRDLPYGVSGGERPGLSGERGASWASGDVAGTPLLFPSGEREAETAARSRERGECLARAGERGRMGSLKTESNPLLSLG